MQKLILVVQVNPVKVYKLRVLYEQKSFLHTNMQLDVFFKDLNFLLICSLFLILNLQCVGGKFNLELKYVIPDAFNVLVLLELIDDSSATTQVCLKDK